MPAVMTWAGRKLPAVAESVLEVAAPSDTVRAVVLVLHGGRAKSLEPVRSRHLTVVRMRPFADSLERAGRRHGLAVARLRYAVRGWNGARQSPLGDVLGALESPHAAHPDAPVALVGHSMGGRAALHAAGHPAVTTVVGLAPWIERGDPVGQVRGRRILLAHGLRDHTTSPRGSAAFVQAAQGIAAYATYVAVHHEGHALIRRPGLWHGLATGYVLAALCDVAPEGTVRRDAANLVGKALAGSTQLDV